MNLLDLFVKIGVEDEASDKIGGISGKIKDGLKTAAKIGGAAVAAAGTAIAGLGKQAVESYADYEQLVGGVETLFGESAGIVQKYADNAFRTAGLSANDYMETVTSFSASLLQSLGGDTEKAAKVADMAITDMSDNANKMGTSMESIQNAYQGFAKQNYTMLDNLKLGYGGTKEEMERLLANAEALPEAMGRDFDISNYADVVEAIHLIQQEMDISGISIEEYNELVSSGAMTSEEAFELLGTTAKESASTISGSVASMKSAWSNLITGIADDNANFGELINNFVESVATVGENIIPRVETAINGIGDLVTRLAPVISEKIPEIVNGVLPSILEAATSLVNGLIDGVVSLLPTIVKSGGDVIMALLDGILKSSDKIVDGATAALLAFVDFITNNLPQIVAVGIEILAKLAVGIIKAIPDLVAKLPQVITAIINTLGASLGGFFNLGANIVNAIWEGIANVWGTLVSWVNGLIQDLWNGITNVIGRIGNIFGVGAGNAGGLDYVPYNGYVTQLHRGEMVLNAREATEYRKNEIQSKGEPTYDSFVADITLNLDGRKIAETVKKYDRQMMRAAGAA